MKEDAKEELYSRFAKYVKVDTKSDENSTTCPSTPGQLELAKIAVADMKAIGLANISCDKNCYVMGTLPANTKKKVPAIGFIAHFDTSPDASGKNVKPQLHKNYCGGPLTVSKKFGVIIDPKDAPGLADCIGEDIVTASGDTLLGADNKAGMAIILTAVKYLKQHPEIKHGAIKVGFTPDEEIGRGADKFDVKRFGARYAYTIDGDVAGTVEDENFNADGLTISIKGKSVHPGSAKNILANAVRIAADIMAAWPENMLSETTEKREGFIMFTSCEASIEEAKIKGIIREHDIDKLHSMEELLKAQVAACAKKYPVAEIKLELREQYRNMKQVLDKHPQVMEYAIAAIRSEGMEPVQKPVRGGTDGARLSFMGLPTPNIFTGGGNFHGKHEWVSVDGMAKAVRTVVALARRWEENS